MRILLTGASGQVGCAVRATAPLDVNVVAYDHQGLDISSSQDAVRLIRGVDLVVNAAAYTAVDAAEHERDAAFSTNAEGARLLAAHCSEIGVPLIHLSTDYVFDGEKIGAWTENDLANPINVYGASKHAGETAVRQEHSHHVIIRTSWVFSPTGRNFVRAMLDRVGTRDRLRVVDDQLGAPTAASDIARAAFTVARQVVEKGGPYGTFHYASDGSTSWYGLAEFVFDIAMRDGWEVPIVEPICSDAYASAARRPLNSVLDCKKVMESYGPSRRCWQDGVEDVVAQLLPKLPRVSER